MTDAPASGGIELRPARERDLPRIVELLNLGSLVAGKEDATDLEPYEVALAEIAHAPGGVLVAEAGGEVVGVCQLIVFRHLQSHGGLCAEIESVHVHPDWRRRGIGRLLLQHAVSLARDMGCYRVQLTSNAARPQAHAFYESLAFEASHVGFKLMLS